MTTRIFGSGIRRREDPRLITGQASYTDDIKLAGLLHAAILRSPHGHARINRIDTAPAPTPPPASPAPPPPPPRRPPASSPSIPAPTPRVS